MKAQRLRIKGKSLNISVPKDQYEKSEGCQKEKEWEVRVNPRGTEILDC